MCIRRKMIIKIERNGIVSKKELKSFRSCMGMLKHLRKEAYRIDPCARIMVLNNIPTLLIHRTDNPDMITVYPAKKEDELQ